MKVANRTCIRNISIKQMKTARLRNRIAIIAIALTTVLFTSLFTIILSVVYGYEQANFRQVGGYGHAGLKNLTEAQFEEFKTDPRITEYGRRVMVGIPTDAPFQKCSVEVSSVDEVYAKFTFADFAEGGLPAENSGEAAADTRVLALLGVTPKIGEEFTMTFDVDGVKTTETFILSGFWEFDEVMPASSVFLPFSRAQAIFDRLGTVKGADGHTGLISLDFMLKGGAAHIEEEVREIIESYGYQCDAPEEERYIAYGVNWGYMSAQIDKLFDPGTAVALLAILLLIVFTGYLIIYNVFRISVSGDIRYYGLLKTIGTTGKQIRRIVRIQAYALSGVGIPVGLLLGYGVGAALTPFVLVQLSGMHRNDLSFNPLIFVFAALFSLATVGLSCRKPSRIAAGISPVEAVRYTESGCGKKTRKGTKGAGIVKMVFANLGRSKGKTAVTVLSLVLSAVLLNLTITFAKGFDMDKYLGRMPADYILADALYFQDMGVLWDTTMGVPQEVVRDLRATGNIAEMGVVYGRDLNDMLCGKGSGQDEEHENPTHLYGMEAYCLNYLKVLDGDITKLYGDGNYIAAVYRSDDYGNIYPESNWARVGDRVTVRYDACLGSSEDGGNAQTAGNPCREAEYEVAAAVVIPYSLTYRFYLYGSDEFILGAETFLRDAGTDSILYLAFEGKEGREDEIEQFLADYTQRSDLLLNYESKATYADEFDSFRNMFLLLGVVLSFIVGMVGALNFVNAVLTGIFARHREFAILQAIGMTGKQLKAMLVTEGLCYTLGASGGSLLLFLVLSPLSKRAMEGMFWFCSMEFTVLPILLLIPVFAVLGAVIPVVSYRVLLRKPVVERIREAQ